ncbi:MAG: hypothetical protein ACRDDY_06335 [Clostridium sp.]|uniref:hypothetical protein n=1 Tax=Clostridium sp. TaxID=1506 RepID=UPI003EE6CBBD
MVKQFNKNKYGFSTARGLVEVGEKLDKVRGSEISLLRKEVYLYDVHIKELARLRPSYRERNIALNIAFYIIDNEEVLKRFREKRKFSIKSLSRKIRISKDFIEKWYGYIVLYIILFSNEDYKNIQNYIRVELREKSELKEPVNKDKVKGLVIKNNSKSVNVLTSTGDVKRLKKEEVSIGLEYEGIEKDFFYKNRFKFLMIFIFISTITSALFYQYNKVATIVVLETTLKVKLETNKFNKVVYSYSGTEKGEKMLTDLKVNGKYIDEAILEIIEYADINEMKPEHGYVMTINGISIDGENFKKTGEYVYKNKVKININNNGTQLNLYTLIKNQKEEEDE